MASPALAQLPSASPAPAGRLTLWYDKPAEFTVGNNEFQTKFKTLVPTALPIGNGAMGALVKGGVSREWIPLNESTLWTEGLDPSGEYAKLGAYQPLGSLGIDLENQASFSGYRRSLDLTTGIARVSYTSNGVHYQREYFASYPNGVVVIHLTADKPGSYSGSVAYTDAHEALSVIDGNNIAVNGGFVNGLRYATQIIVLNDGGAQQAHHDEYHDTIEFKGCDSFTILAAAGTNYVMDYGKIADNAHYRTATSPGGLVAERARAAAALPYPALKAAHVADYQSLFNRFSIDLGPSSASQTALPTDLRRQKAARATDPEFEALVCQYGRYLMIACSRPGGVAANNCGIWNDTLYPCMGGVFCDDIAPTEMTYWAVETTNLAECHLPLLDLIQSQLPAWRRDTQTSEELKLASGELSPRGWTIRGCHNIMGGMAYWWNTPGNAWYCNHFWEHYAFGQDKAYLAKIAYPIIKETCGYWEDHLKPLPDGRLVVPHMFSPEHGPWEDGTSYGQELVWDLFSNYMDASDILGIDKDYRDRIAALRDKLLVPGVGSWGQLKEWMIEKKQGNPAGVADNGQSIQSRWIDTPQDHHRHTSHLLGVYPFRQISFEQTPELARAALVSLKARGNGGDADEWSYAARGPIYARLHRGDLAHNQIQQFIHATYPNLFGNLGFMEFDGPPAIPETFAEMLVQSQLGYISLLPALTQAWPGGSVKGLRSRGGFEVDESWANGKLTSATIRSVAGHGVEVHYGDKIAKFPLQPGQSVTIDGNLQTKG